MMMVMVVMMMMVVMVMMVMMMMVVFLSIFYRPTQLVGGCSFSYLYHSRFHQFIQEYFPNYIITFV